MVNMEEMIREEIGKISELKERVLFKDIVEQIFLSLYETNREMYQTLEHRVMDELFFDINRYGVSSIVMDKHYIDHSHHLLSPIREKDLLEKSCTTETLKEDWKVKGKSRIKTLFMEADYLQIVAFLEKKTLKGSVITDRRELPVEFYLEQNTSYIEELDHLYKIFVQNGIPWKTLNTPYFYKFVDVYLTDKDIVFEAGESVVEIKVNLEEFTELAREYYIPLWNVRKLTLNSVGFPVPCTDYKNFEHTISIRDYGDSHVYLIDDTDSIFHLRQFPGKLVVTTKEAEARKWDIIMIRKGENKKFERYEVPLMENIRNESFPELFWKKQGVEVKTKAELSRFIQGFGLEKYIKFKNFVLNDVVEENKETYSMNPFIIDEVRRKDAAKQLILCFQGSQKLKWLQRDIMSFLVSEVQLLYPEYQCVGKLEECST